MESGLAGANDNFIEQVRRALEHMYDLPYLQRHPLALAKGINQNIPGETPGQSLRRILFEIIETLNPGPGVFFRSPQARPYQMLQMHCVYGMPITEAAGELGISERQAYRDLRQGEETVIAVLWNRLKLDETRKSSSDAHPTAPPDASPSETVQEEIAHLASIRQRVDLIDLLKRAVKSVEKLANLQSVEIRANLPSQPFWLPVNIAGAQQLLVSLLSRAVQGASHSSTINLSFVSEADNIAQISIEFSNARIERLSFSSDALISGLVYRLNWELREMDAQGELRRVELAIAPKKNIVLVIDDNEGLRDLFERFMTGLDCQMISARSGLEGLELALESHPSAIILDVMMPDMDGWEVLQRLRSDPRTAPIPVGICSVVDDPGLAYSLGATLLITKPVTREKILSALRQIGLVG